VPAQHGHPAGGFAVPTEPSALGLTVRGREQRGDGGLGPGGLLGGLGQRPVGLRARLGEGLFGLAACLREQLLGPLPRGLLLGYGAGPGLLRRAEGVAAESLGLAGRLGQQPVRLLLRLLGAAGKQLVGGAAQRRGLLLGAGEQLGGLAPCVLEDPGGLGGRRRPMLLRLGEPRLHGRFGLGEHGVAVGLGGPQQQRRLLAGVRDQLSGFFLGGGELLVDPLPVDQLASVPLLCLGVQPLRLLLEALGLGPGPGQVRLRLLAELVGHLLGPEQHLGGGVVAAGPGRRQAVLRVVHDRFSVLSGFGACGAHLPLLCR
jgi:hypothetical protein